MTDPNKPEDQNGGAGGAGGGNPPAGTQKTVEQRLQEMEEGTKKTQALLQSTQEELKRVNNLNTVLMRRLPADGGGSPQGGGGMDASRTTPIKLKRDFSQIDPAEDPQRFATELVLETAEQVRDVIAQQQGVQQQNTELRKAFYEKNKDLVGWERVVGTFSDEVQVANPHLSFAEAAELVAQRTRDFVKARGSSTDNPDNPPHTLPPGRGDDHITVKPPKGGSQEPFNPDKAYEEDMKDYTSMRAKERTRDGSGKSG